MANKFQYIDPEKLIVKMDEERMVLSGKDTPEEALKYLRELHDKTIGPRSEDGFITDEQEVKLCEHNYKLKQIWINVDKLAKITLFWERLLAKSNGDHNKIAAYQMKISEVMKNAEELNLVKHMNIRIGNLRNTFTEMCNTCNETECKIRACSRCHIIKYCSKNCQRLDWPNHKLICV